MSEPSVRLEEFDLWRPGYGFATVTVYIGGTTTLAAIFTDEACTHSAANPQTLLQQSFSGISYGKWAQPLYTQTPYQLQINSVDQTGVVGVPLTTLEGQDASLATVIPTGGSVAGNLDDILGRTVNVLDYGDFLAVGVEDASATTNTNTLDEAISEVSGKGGGDVELPAGTFQYTAITLPANVVLVGQGQAATILQSTEAVTPVNTISGSFAGFRNLTLDGLEQVTDSIGVYSEVINQIILDNVKVQRFSTGIQTYGGSGHNWRNLSLSDCVIGWQGHGYSDSGKGGPLQFCQWQGGIVDTCTTAGVELENIDELCQHISIDSVQFNDNEGIGVHILGARGIIVSKGSWNGNTTDLQIEDGAPLNVAANNTVIGVEITDGSFVGTGADGADINLNGTLQNVAFRRCEFTNETITLTAPQHNVLLQDCRQISGVSIAGTATSLIQSFTYADGETVGLTTGNAATPAWSKTLQSGQRVYVEVKATARARNNADSAWFHYGAGASCALATLSFDAQTANFTASDVVTGKTSGATARIATVTQSAGTGTVSLQDVTGTFLNNELITDTGGGSATVNGSITQGAASWQSQNAIYGPIHTDTAWAITFTASGQQIVVNVTGDTAMNVEWFVNVGVTSSSQIE